ncbi:hypothetical protein L9F63_001618 [Diploptera punctata]|uniref:Eukaryotic translation initiation factor 3 subunit J n=1 Tax=Diploptera punctata TaxID=6984 RepID=A0AAD8A3M3_DIPPU|nr:hypothetical protein L9F63_001618 [Diploptera punctata]
MDGWDADNFQPKEIVPVAANKWEGEDEDEDVKDNWEDEEEEEEKKDVEKQEPPKPLPTKKKKTLLAEKIEEREQKLREEAEKKVKAREATKEELTPEEILEEKIRQQKLQEESDLQVALETFGVAEPGAATGIDAINPSTKEEFDELQSALTKKIQLYTKSPHFPGFAEDLIRNICVNLASQDLKKLKTTVENMFLEKTKVEKGDKAKKNKGKGKAKLRVEGENALVNEYSAYGDYDYDDFM